METQALAIRNDKCELEHNDKLRELFSDDLINYARERGWYTYEEMVQNITILYTGLGIINYRGIKYLKKIYYLNTSFSHSEACDFSQLTELTYLRVVVFYSIQQSFDVSQLKNLGEIYFYGSYKKSYQPMSPLTNLTKMKTLNLFFVNIPDAGDWSNLTLNSVNIYHSNLKKITGLNNHLTRLTIQRNQLTTIDLTNATNLTYLNLDSSGITSQTGIENLTKLTYLNLRATSPGQIDFSNLTSLQYIDMNMTNIPSIQSLMNITSLTYLQYFAQSAATETSYNVGNLINLTTLILNGFICTSVTGIENLTKLTNLDLSVNQISDLDTSNYPQSITTFYFTQSQIIINSITGLRHLINVTRLSFYYNNLSQSIVDQILSDAVYLYNNYGKLTYLRLDSNSAPTNGNQNTDYLHLTSNGVTVIISS